MTSHSYPLVVDLDGTLLNTDTLHESALQLLRDQPASILRIPGWLVRGKAYMKRRISSLTELNVETLPYNQPFIEWLRTERAAGRRLVLCTATDRSIAEAIAGHLQLFDEVIATDGTVNLAGDNKARELETRFGKQGFDYAGNAAPDLAVWERAREAVVVNASRTLLATAKARCTVTRVFEAPVAGLQVWRRALRLHQWLKNLLLFMPLLAAHQLSNLQAWSTLALAFVAFSLCASSVYLANDLLDLESDRLHPRKRARPFASGALPVWVGVALAPILLAASAGLASLLDSAFLGWLSLYFGLTCAYSWLLKRLILVDCLTLAVLYTLRVLAGGAAVGLALSFWLLAFSGFLFLSLAFVKRYAELELQRTTGRTKLHGRGYLTSDTSLIQTMGITAGQASVLVLALYLNSDAVTKLYRHPEVVWGAVPVMLFWIHWMWMQAHRGRMHDDPLVFAVKDRTSLFAGLCVAAVLVAGTVTW
ncbi:MAG: UbiA family prenyltransferase [Mitsuaria chitosanitabida]|uniref:UbiA family prenyltransferase n=1 Tax=Roseateles chitosanitabidus TaxID=65048 RepID=UPI001B08CE6F|nr:UbiA family prenyltransferase [Roseateles chitosanitabidus]MBO9688681.1 UbiA family prenyltransferase [Roseateles chitosanitabidus]